jgi:hypothetical protein
MLSLSLYRSFTEERDSATGTNPDLEARMVRILDFPFTRTVIFYERWLGAFIEVNAGDGSSAWQGAVCLSVKASGSVICRSSTAPAIAQILDAIVHVESIILSSYYLSNSAASVGQLMLQVLSQSGTSPSLDPQVQ